MKFKPSFQGIAAFLSIISLVVLAFLGGSATMRYNLPVSLPLKNAFFAAESWYRLMNEAPLPATATEMVDNEHIITHPKIAWDKANAFNGYTLISTGFLFTPYLVDMAGTIVHRWRPPYSRMNLECLKTGKTSRPFANQAHMYPNGDLLMQFGNWGAPYGCGIAKLDTYSNVLWVYRNLVHHDFQVDKKGAIYTLAQNIYSTPPQGLEQLQYPLVSSNVVKLSPEGDELMTIPLLEAFQGTPYELFLYHSKADGDTLEDWLHANSVDVLDDAMAKAFPQFSAGHILVSLRTIGALAVIDPDTRKVVWATRGPWNYQHSASFLANGHILLFDNRGHTENAMPFSRIIEFDPKNMQTSWHYSGHMNTPFISNYAGRVQRLADGNTLVTESLYSKIFELTPSGKIVWSYQIRQIEREGDTEKFLSGIYGAKRYSPAEAAFLSPAAPK